MVKVRRRTGVVLALPGRTGVDVGRGARLATPRRADLRLGRRAARGPGVGGRPRETVERGSALRGPIGRRRRTQRIRGRADVLARCSAVVTASSRRLKSNSRDCEHRRRRCWSHARCASIVADRPRHDLLRECDEHRVAGVGRSSLRGTPVLATGGSGDVLWHRGDALAQRRRARGGALADFAMDARRPHSNRQVRGLL